jgi:NADPH2 dehydrogenase
LKLDLKTSLRKMALSKLFSPGKLGSIYSDHRVILAPMSRLRASDDHVPSALDREFFRQRACVPGTILFTNMVLACPAAGGLPNASGIWNEKQVTAWKEIVQNIHDRGCKIVCQIGGMGRAAFPHVLDAEGLTMIGPSAIPKEGSRTPTPMTKTDIDAMIFDFTHAARNAMEAGFDGLELHGNNGELLDQFIQDVSNQRDDEYGGSIENRNRFAVDITKAVVAAVGAHHVGFRISPLSTWNSMRMEDPISQFTDLIKQLQEIGIAWLHAIEPRISGYDDVEGNKENLDFIYNTWKGTLIIAGNHTAESAEQLMKVHPEHEIMVAFGRRFLANPDLVFRFREGIELTPYDRETFYTPKTPKGYVNYPFSEEFLESTGGKYE